MVQGTTSDAGKSTLVAGLGRVLRRRKIGVAPFKPQNMALNSAVTVDGGEIGRAQAVQAQACGIEPHTDMNPVLLKPNTDTGAQVIIHGKVFADMNAVAYHDYKPRAMQAVLESYRRLQSRYECILVEGAGSPAEINLRDKDIANMGFAEAVDCPVILIADIDRGGVFAHLVGTLEVLSETERARVVGFVINRFRGELSLLQPGLDWLSARTGKPVIGVLPYMTGLHLEAEDSLAPSATHREARAEKKLQVIVPVYPRTSNHTDFDALRLHSQVDLRFVGAGEHISAADLIVLPGSKSVRADLEWLQAQGYGAAIRRHLRYGGKVIGICGGFQMLGQAIHDPLGVESDPGSCAGLRLLDIETTLRAAKYLARVEGTLIADGAAVCGYEIHMGETTGKDLERPAIRLNSRNDGVFSADGQIIGTYLHGIFDHASACQSLLRWAGLDESGHYDYIAVRDAHIDRLADSIEQHLDFKCLSPFLPSM